VLKIVHANTNMFLSINIPDEDEVDLYYNEDIGESFMERNSLEDDFEDLHQLNLSNIIFVPMEIPDELKTI
jgi:hypothetical protein